MVENMTAERWSDVLKTLTVEGSLWLNEEGRVVNKIDLKLVAKVWVKFLKSRLMYTTHTTTISFCMPFSRVSHFMLENI